MQRDNSGWRSHLFVQNASGSPANATVRFYPPKQSECRLDYTVPGGGSVKVDVYGVNCMDANYDTYSVVLIAQHPIVAEANNWLHNHNGDNIGSYAGVHR